MKNHSHNSTTMSETISNKLLDSLKKKFGAGIVSESEDVRTFSSGSLAYDIASGIRGLPYGRLVEVYGPESSGKTTLAIHAMISCQKNEGENVAFIDMEHAFDPRYAAALGLDLSPNKMLFSQPDSAEQALSLVEELVGSGEFGLIVLDSVAALVPQTEVEGEMGEAKMGVQARLMGQAMRKLIPIIGRSGTCVIFLNQIREKIGVLFGSPEYTTGGNALKFAASVRVDIRSDGSVTKDKDGNKTAKPIKMTFAKNKLAPPFTVAHTLIRFGEGICVEKEILDLGVQFEIISKTGSWYSYNDEKLGQGEENSIAYLQDNPEFTQFIKKQILDHVETGKS